MLTLLWLVLGGYALGVLLPLCVRKPQSQNMAASIPAAMASASGIALGLSGLTASDPLTASVGSTIPLLTFAVRLDALAGFFVLTLSLAGLAASIFAIGYVRHFDGRVSVAALGSLFNAFLCSMTL